MTNLTDITAMSFLDLEALMLSAQVKGACAGVDAQTAMDAILELVEDEPTALLRRLPAACARLGWREQGLLARVLRRVAARIERHRFVAVNVERVSTCLDAADTLKSNARELRAAA